MKDTTYYIRRVKDGAFFSRMTWRRAEGDTAPAGANLSHINSNNFRCLAVLAGGVVWQEGKPWPPEVTP